MCEGAAEFEAESLWPKLSGNAVSPGELKPAGFSGLGGSRSKGTAAGPQDHRGPGRPVPPVLATLRMYLTDAG